MYRFEIVIVVGGFHGYSFKLLGDTIARFVSLLFIRTGASVRDERRRGDEAARRAEAGLAGVTCRGFL